MPDNIKIADDKDTLGSMILERLSDRRKDYSRKHEEWERNEKKLQGKIEGAYPYRNRASIKYIKSTLGTLVPQYVGSMIGDVGHDFFDMLPEEPEDEKQVGLNKQVMTKHVESVRLLEARAAAWTHDTLTYGPGYVMNPWRVESRTVNRWQQIEQSKLVELAGRLLRLNFPPKFEKERERKITYRGFDMVNWSVFNLYEADLSQLDLQRQPYIFANFITNFRELEQKQKEMAQFPDGPQIVNLDDVKEKGPFTTDDEEEKKRRIRELYGIDEKEPYTDDELVPVKIIQYFSIPENRWMWITHSGVNILRQKDDEWAAELPYDHGMYPLAKMVNRPSGNNGLGESEVDLIADLSDLIDLSVNAREDWKSTAAHPMWLLDTTAGFRLKEILRSEPGKVLRGFDINGLKQLETKIDLTGIVDEDRFKNDIKILTGAVDAIRGQGKEGTPETATLGAAMVNAALTRFKLQVRINEAMGLKDWLHLGWRMLMQFMTEDQVVRITGQKGAEWLKVPRDNFLIDYDFKLLAGTEAFHTDIEKQHLLQLMQVMQGAPNLNIEAFQRRLFRLSKVPNPEELVHNPKLRDPNVENFRLLQGQQVMVDPMDNDEAHLAAHAALLNSRVMAQVPEAAQFIQDHIEQHQFQAATKAAEQGQGAAPGAASSGIGGLQAASGDFTAQGTGNRGPGSQTLAGV